MKYAQSALTGLPLLAATALAGANYPAIPSDKSTPVQQRLAVIGPSGKQSLVWNPGTRMPRAQAVTLSSLMLTIILLSQPSPSDGTHTSS